MTTDQSWKEPSPGRNIALGTIAVNGCVRLYAHLQLENGALTTDPDGKVILDGMPTIEKLREVESLMIAKKPRWSW